MRVVLDSNIIKKSTNYSMDSAQFEAVLGSSGNLELSFLIPEVVVDEVVDLYARELRGLFDQYSQATERLQRLSGRNLVTAESDGRTELEILSYRTNLPLKLSRPPYRILRYPSIPHRDAAAADIAKRRPFNPKGGYRDYLIWQSILEEVARDPAGDPVYLISGNTNDFAGDPVTESGVKRFPLHSDLIADLVGQGLNPEAVLYFPSLELFRDQVIKPLQEELKSLAEEVKRGDFPDSDLYANIERSIRQWLADKLLKVDVAAYGLSEEVKWIESAELISVGNIEFADVRSVSDDSISVDLVVPARVRFTHAALGDSATLSGGGLLSFGEYQAGETERELKFIVTSIVNRRPQLKVIRTDAILLRPVTRGLKD